MAISDITVSDIKTHGLGTASYTAGSDGTVYLSLAPYNGVIVSDVTFSYVATKIETGESYSGTGTSSFDTWDAGNPIKATIFPPSSIARSYDTIEYDIEIHKSSLSFSTTVSRSPDSAPAPSYYYGVDLSVYYRSWTLYFAFSSGGGEYEYVKAVARYEYDGSIQEDTVSDTRGYVSGDWPDSGLYLLSLVAYYKRTYTVSFDPVDGTVSPVSKSVVYYEPSPEKYGSLPEPKKDGFDFVGWFTEKAGGEIVNATTDVTNPNPHTLYAHWKLLAVTIKFNTSGGSPQPEPVSKTPGEQYGKLPEVARNGYSFNGWFTSETGGTKVTETSVVPASDTTLYAQWTGLEYTLTVNPNHGVYDNSTQPVIKNPNLKSGTSTWCAIGVATRTGYTLLGYWLDGKKVYDENGYCVKGTYWSDSYANNGKYIGASDLTVSAGWDANQYTVILDPTGGTVQPSSIVVTFDSTYGAEGSLPVPVKDGFEFEGWFTEDSGGTRVDDDTKVTVPEDHTIYAHWKEEPPPTTRVTVTFDPKGGEVNPQTKEYDSGAALTGLPVPTYTHHGFKGWFYEEGYETRVKETDTVTSDITVYAKWGNSVGLFGYLVR